MNKNTKVKETPKTFYICDRELKCSGSEGEICGNLCTHTQQYSHRAKRDIREKDRKWRVMNNGDRFEK